MDKWLNHISDSPSNTLQRRQKEEFTWRNVELSLGSGDLKARVDESREWTTEPLEYVSLSVPGVHIWKIKGGACEHWKREDYGQFYESNCFIILKIRHNKNDSNDATTYNLHLWAGRLSTATDYRMAVYRMIEINCSLNNSAIIHRELQGKESQTFWNNFQYVTYLKKTAEESYSNVRRRNATHPLRLFKIYKPDPKKVKYLVTEVPARKNQLNNSFVYIMDRGTSLFQWNGQLCKTEDILKAAQYIQTLKASRGLDIKVDTLNDQDEEDGMHPLHQCLTGASYLHDEEEEDAQKTLVFPTSKRLAGTGAKGLIIRCTTNQSKGFHFKKVKDGIILLKDVMKEMTCIIDLGHICFLWYSHKVSGADKPMSLEIIHEYLQDIKQPLMSFVILSEGQTSAAFSRALHK